MKASRQLIALSVVALLFAACGEESEDDLGATANQSPDQIQAITYDGELAIGEPRQFRFWTHCGIERLGKFNGEEWLLATPPSGQAPSDSVSYVPSGWDSYMDPNVDEEIVLRLELTEGGQIQARPVDAPVDQGVTYESTTEPDPGCD